MNPLAIVISVAALGTSLCLAADPSKIEALLREGERLDRQCETRSALEAFSRAEQLDPDCVDALLRISKEYTDLILTASSPAERETYAHKALDYALRCVKLAPENSKANLSAAVAYGLMTDYVSPKVRLEYSRKVKQFADKAVSLDPKDDFAFHVLGRWSYGIANISPVLKAVAKLVYGGLPEASNEQAVDYYLKAVHLAPSRIAHRSELARTYTALGRRELARQQWQAVLSLPVQSAADMRDKKSASEALSQL